MPDKVIILEKWTHKGGIRKIGDGPWEPILPLGFVPFVVVNPQITHWQTETWMTPREAELNLLPPAS